MSASASAPTSTSASASASTSTNPPFNPASQPPSTPNHASTSTPNSHGLSQAQSASPSLPHSPETARQIAEARAAIEASMNNIGSSLDHTLKSRAQNLHSNSAALEKQQSELVKETEKMRKETDKLKKVADEGAKRVKELGNVQNWAEMLERDFLVLGETMKLVRQGDKGSGWDGQEEGWETSSGSESWSSEDREDEETDRGHGMEGVRRDGMASGVEQQEPDSNPKTAQKAVDGAGDTAMDTVYQHTADGASKGKQAVGQSRADACQASSPTVTGDSRTTFTADPSSALVHTAACTGS